MKIKLPLTLALIALCFASVYAQQNKLTLRVVLDVSVKDEIKNDVISYISRELRSLGDVVIVEGESDPQYKILVIGGIGSSKLKQNLGYAFSVVVTRTRKDNAQLAELLIPKCVSKEIKDSLVGFMTSGESLLHYTLLTDSDLRRLCSDLVTGIDGDVFNETRRTYQRLRDKPLPSSPTPSENKTKNPQRIQ